MVAPLVTAAAAFGLLSCSNSGANLDELGKQAKVKVEVVSGNSQTGMPKLPFKNEFVFRVTDNKGSPLPRIRVGIALVNLTGPSDPNDADVQKALRENLLTPWAIRPELPSARSGLDDVKLANLENDFLGRVESNDNKTDLNGLVRSVIAAPSRFDERLGVVLFVGQDAAASAGFGFSVVKTKTASQGARLQLATSGRGKQSAGRAFELSVRIVDEFGNLDRTFDQKLSLQLSHTAKSSWTGREPSLPSTFDCLFESGICNVSGGPYVLNRAEKVQFTLKDTNAIFADSTTEVQVDAEKAPFSIVAANKSGGESGGATIIKEIAITTDEAVELSAAYIDAGGNFLGSVDDADWKVTNLGLQAYLPKSATPGFKFEPAVTGFGELTISSPQAKTLEGIRVNVPSGPQRGWKVTTEKGNVLAAAECTNLQVEAVDAKGNTVSTLDGLVPLWIQLEGANPLPRVFDITHLRRGLQKIGESADVIANFTAGKSILSERLCGFKATVTDSMLFVRGNSLESRTPFRVSLGAPSSILLSTTNPSAEIANACLDFAQAGNFEAPCLNFSADKDSISLFSVLTDAGGNTIRVSPVRWTATGPISSQVTSTALAPSLTFTPDKMGKGYLQLATDDGFKTDYAYQTVPGAAVNLLVQSQNLNREIATNPFKISMEWRDKRGNLATTLNQRMSMNVSATLSNKSPSGADPISGFSEEVNFQAGKALTLGQLHIVKAGDAPNIRVEYGTSAFVSDPVTIAPGVRTNAKLRTSPGNQGSVIDSTRSMQVNEVLSIFLAAYDSLGNYIDDVSSSFTGSIADITSALTQTSGRTTNFIPTATMEGTIAVTTLDAPSLSVTSPILRVTAKSATRYDLTTTNGLSETAGQPFDVIVKAVDNQGNIDIDYQGVVKLRVISQSPAAWLGKTANLPSGDIDCTFALGLCTLPRTGQAVTNLGWTSHDAESITVLSVQDVSTTPKILKPATALVTIVKDVAASLIISSKAGGKVGASVPYDTSKVLTAISGTDITFFASLADASGNWIEDVGAVWSGSVADIHTGINPKTGSSTTFSPVKSVPSATLTAQFSSFSATMPITVVPGAPVGVRIVEENGNTTLQPGSCYKLNVDVVDANANTVSNYSSLLDMKIALTDYTRTAAANDRRTFVSGLYVQASGEIKRAIIENDPVYSSAPYIDPAKGWNAGGVIRGVTFSSGILAERVMFCAADAGPAVSPKIHIALPTITLTTPAVTYPALTGQSASWSVPIGSPAWIGFTEAGGLTPGCKVSLVPQSASNQVIPFSDLFPSGFGSTTPTQNCSSKTEWGLNTFVRSSLSYDAYVYDRGGNYIRDADGAFTFDLKPSSENILSQTSKQLNFQARKGSFEKNPANMSALYSFYLKDTPSGLVSPRFDLYLSASAAASMNVELPSTPMAGQTFAATVTFYDAFNNLTGVSLPGSIAVTDGGTAITSPGGVDPTIPASLAVSGNWNGGVSYQSGLDFMVSTSGSPVTLTFTPDNGGIPPRSVTINPVPGPAASGYLAAKDTASVEVTQPINFITTQVVDYVYMLRDAAGNIIGNATIPPASLALTGVMTGKWTFREFNTTLRVAPTTAGIGTFSFTPPFGLAAYDSGIVTVTDAPISTFAINIAGATGTNGNIVVAGSTYAITLTAKDAVGNTLTGFNGTKLILGTVSPQNENPEGRRTGLELPPGNLVEFTNGVSNAGQITLTAMNSAEVPSLIFGFSDAATGASATSSMFVTIQSGVFHHYGVKPGASSYTPTWNRSTSFSATVSLRDAVGNILSAGGPGIPVTLAIRKTLGSASGTLGGTTTIASLSTPVTITDLKYDEIGNFRVVAEDGSTPVINDACPPIAMLGSTAMIKEMKFFPPSLVTAGNPIGLSVVAYDGYNRPVPGMDEILEGLSYTFTGFQNSPKGDVPGLNLSYYSGFNSGSGSFTYSLYNAQTHAPGSLGATVSGSYSASLTNSTQMIVQPGALAEYNITSSHTTRTADSDPTSGAFNLRVQAFDLYGNSRSGEATVSLTAEIVSGGPLPTEFQGPSNYTNLNPLPYVFSMATGDVTLNNLVYYSAATVKIGLTGSNLTYDSQTRPTITFSPTIGTIRTYDLTLPGSAIVGANNYPVSIKALDGAGNTITGIDSILNNPSDLTYQWLDFNTSGNGTNPTLPRPVFSNGVGTSTFSLYASQTIFAGDLIFQDNRGFKGRNQGQIEILSSPAVSMVISSVTTPTTVANFELNIQFNDIFGNGSAVSTPSTLNFSLNNSAPASPKGTLSANPASMPVVFNFNPYTFRTGEVFRIPNGGFTSYLTIAPASGTIPPVMLTIKPEMGPVTLNMLSSDIGGASQLVSPLIYSTSDRPVIYYVQKDNELNVVGIAPVTVAGTGALASRLSTDAALTSVTLAATQTGSGSFTITPINPVYPPLTIASVTILPSPATIIGIEILGATGVSADTVNAGQSYQVRLSAYDLYLNLVTSFSGRKNLTALVSPSNANPEGRSNGINLPSQTVNGNTTRYADFTNGVTNPTQISFSPFNSAESPQIQIIYSDDTPNAAGTKNMIVQSGPFHHYGAASVPSYASTWDRANTFSTTISLRDSSGNILNTGGPGGTVTLSIKQSNGSNPRGALSGTTSISNLTTPVTISDLKYDDYGTFVIIAEDGTTSTPLSGTTAINMAPTFKHVKEFKFVLSSNTTVAGALHSSDVQAIDAYNTPIQGIDAELSRLTYTFSGPGTAPGVGAAVPPVFPSPLAFSAGIAPVTATYNKAETLGIGSIQVNVSGSAVMTGTPSYIWPSSLLSSTNTSNTAALTVSPAPLDSYRITSAQSTATADGDASTGRFNVTIEAFDFLGNPRSGQPNLTLSAVRVSGPTNATNVTDSSKSTAGTSNLDLTSGSLTLTNLTYLVPQTIRFRMTGTSVTSVSTAAQIAFTPTLNTVASYSLGLPSTVLAGFNNLAVTTSALDIAGNVVTGIDGSLNNSSLITYTWSGAPTSPSPTSAAPVYGSGTFSNGLMTATHSLFGAAMLGGGIFKVTDSLGRIGTNTLPLTIDAGTALTLTPNTLSSQVAGTPFTITAIARDSYSNPTGTGCSTLNVTGGNTSPGVFNGVATPPSLPVPSTQGITGYYTTPNITLYSANYDLVEASVANPNRLTLAACGISTTVDVVVFENVAETVVLSTASTLPASIAANITELVCNLAPGTSSAVTCPSVYGFYWDQYGNRVDPEYSVCAWTYTDNGAVAAGSVGVPNVIGGGFSYTVAHTDFIDGQLRCRKGAKWSEVNVYGGVSRIAFTRPNSSTITANNNNVTVSSVTLYGRKNNVEIVVPQIVNPETVSFTSGSVVGGMGSLGGTNTSAASSVACTFNTGTGVCPTPYSFNFNRTESAGFVTLSVRGKSLSTPTYNVVPNWTTQVVGLSPPASATAGTPFTVTIESRDVFNNPTDLTTGGAACSTASITNLTAPTSPGAIGGTGTGTATAPVIPSMTKTGVGRYLSGDIILYSQQTNQGILRYNACGQSVTPNLVVNPAPITSVTIKTAGDTVGSAVLVSGGSTANQFCASSGAATGDAVTCPAFHAYVYDTYGNQVHTTTVNNVASGSATTTPCTWSYTNLGGANGSVSPSVPGPGHSWTPTINGVMDGRVSCTANGITASVNTYGGIHSIRASTVNGNSVGTGNTFSLGSNLVAANTNLTIASLQLWYSVNGTLVQRSDSPNEQINLTSDYGGSTVPWGTTASVHMGQNQTPSYVFSSGALASLSFNFFKTTSPTPNRFITATIRNRPFTVNSINVDPANASSMTFSPSTSTPVAGTAFTGTTQIFDQFLNLTPKTNAGADCSAGSLTIGSSSVSSPSTSPAGGGAVTSFSSAAVTGASSQASTGTYSLGNLILYNAAATNTLNVSGCGVSASAATFTVSPKTSANVQSVLNTSSTINTASLSELECNNSGAAAWGSVACSSLYAWFWDQYGNPLTSSNTCDSWSYAPESGTTSPTTFPTSASASQTALRDTSASFFDGVVTCNKATATTTARTLRLWGGVRDVLVTTSPASGATMTVTAAGSNLSVTNITLQAPKAGVATTITQGGSKSIIPSIANYSLTTWGTTTSPQTLGQNNPFSCTFASGACTTSIPFNFLKSTSSAAQLGLSIHNRPITTVNGSASATINVNVNPANASSMTFTPSTTTPGAGSAFTGTVQIYDAFLNLTPKTNAGADCSAGSLSIGSSGVTSPSTSPAGGGVATSFSSAAVTGTSSQASTGTYSLGNIILYNAAVTNTLNVSGCGVSASAANFTVSPKTSANVQSVLNTSSTINTASLSELECNNSGAAAWGSVACSSLYAWFWDQYGNPLTSSNTCDSWSYTPESATSSPTTFPTAASASQVALLNTTASFFDGVVTCNKATATTTARTLRLWGGVRDVLVTTSPASGATMTVTAATGNLSVTNITLQAPKAGVATTVSQGGSKTITPSISNYSLTTWGTAGSQLGQNNPFTCTFASGACTTSIPFNFIRSTSSAAQLGLSIHNRPISTVNSNASANINVNVNPANASSMTFTPSTTTPGAGTAFTGTVQIYDAFSNLTNKTNAGADCSAGSLTIGSSGATSPSTSPAGGGAATSFSSAAVTGASSQASTGTYSLGNIILYNAAATNTLNVSGCGVAASAANFTVSPKTSANVQSVLNTSSTINTASLSELECNNSGAAAWGSVACSSLYAWFWDQYGNPLTSSNTCDSWSYTPESSTSSPTTFPTSASASQTALLNTAASFFDGVVTCNKATATTTARTLRLWGGVKDVVVTTSPASGATMTVTAGGSNLSVTNITLQAPKAGVATTVSQGGSKTITPSIASYSLTTWGTTTSPQTLGQNNPFSCTFTSGACSTSIPFNFLRSTTTAQLGLSIHNRPISTVNSSAAANIRVNVNNSAATTVSLNNTTQANAGTALSQTATVLDAWGNTVTSGCGDLTLSAVSGATSPGNYGGTATSPLFPGNVTGTAGVYGPYNLTLYNVSTTNLIKYTVASCLPGGFDNNLTVTNPSTTVNTVYLHTTNALPASGGSLASATCTTGTTVSCPQVNAFAWDAFGNNIAGPGPSPITWVCPAWSFVAVDGNTSPTNSTSTSVHNVSITSSTTHINGALRCTAGSAQGSINMTGVIQKSMSLSNSNPSWTCSSGSPVATFTVNNTSGYASSATSVTGQSANNSVDLGTCASGVANGGSCNFSITGTTGSSSGNAIVLSSTSANSAQATFNNSTGLQVSSNAVAPNCTLSLTPPTPSAGQWSCEANTGLGLWSANFTNNNAQQNATLASSNPLSIASINGEVIKTTGCGANSASVTANGGTCNAQFTQTTGGRATTLQINPVVNLTTASSVTTTNSPNCSRALTVTAASPGTCSGTGPKNKSITFTVTNPNTLQNMSISSITANVVGGGLAAASITGCGNGGATTLNAGASCNMTIQYNGVASPGPGPDALITINTGTTTFFATGQIFNSGANYDTSCP